MGFRLDWSTPPAWVARVAERPLELLSDHAHCELKAAASAQAMVAKNGHLPELVDALGAVAIEELEHFRRVHDLLRERGGALLPQDVNPYAEALLDRSAATRSRRFLDRLLDAGPVFLPLEAEEGRPVEFESKRETGHRQSILPAPVIPAEAGIQPTLRTVERVSGPSPSRG